MTIARRNHFYSVFRVDESTFDDIRKRLEAENLLIKHLLIDEYSEEVLVFGSTGFKKEQSQF